VAAGAAVERQLARLRALAGACVTIYSFA
jgi:hypothetical protein